MQEDANTKTDSPGGSAGRPLSRPRVRLGAVIAVAGAAALIVWAVTGGGSNSSPTTASAPPNGSVAGTGPVALSPQGLRNFSRTHHQPIYWAGPKPGYTYEFSLTNSGKAYVRYLPRGVKIGDKSARFLIIATYPFPNSFSALKRVAHGKVIQPPGGGIAVVDEGYPRSVHVAFNGVDYQVEVYDPSPRRALAEATSGDVGPVR